jgi:20S proteasome alpha/beta subunit
MISHLLSKLPAPRAAELGFNMSVCIAILCEERKTIVTVSDLKVNFGDFSAEGIVVKDIPFCAGNSILLAGDDMEYAAPILDRAKQIIGAGYKPPNEVADAIDEAFRDQLQKQIENRVLRKRGFTAATFLDKGKQKCTPTVYLALCNRIEQVSIKLKFLVCGFDENKIGHIYLVDGENAPANYDSVGMWAIGSGAHAALSTLAYFANRLDITVNKSAGEATYFGMTAKYMAESSDQVGKKEPFVCVVDASRKGKYINYRDLVKIRQLWEQDGAPRVPDNLIEFMKPLLNTLQEAKQLAAQKSAPVQ